MHTALKRPYLQNYLTFYYEYLPKIEAELYKKKEIEDQAWHFVHTKR